MISRVIMVVAHVFCFTPKRRLSNSHRTDGQVGLRVCLDIVEKKKCLASARIQTLDHPAHGLHPKISVTTVGHVQWKKAGEVMNWIRNSCHMLLLYWPPLSPSWRWGNVPDALKQEHPCPPIVQQPCPAAVLLFQRQEAQDQAGVSSLVSWMLLHYTWNKCFI